MKVNDPIFYGDKLVAYAARDERLPISFNVDLEPNLDLKTSPVAVAPLHRVHLVRVFQRGAFSVWELDGDAEAAAVILRTNRMFRPKPAQPGDDAAGMVTAIRTLISDTPLDPYTKSVLEHRLEYYRYEAGERA